MAFIKTIQTKEKIKLYAFSVEKDALVADFDEVADKMEAVPLPEAIYNAYRATFRLLKLDRKVVDKKATKDAVTTNELFTTTTQN